MKKAIFAALVLVVLFAPAISFAAGITGPIVPRAGSGGPNASDYNLCDLRDLANNVINFAVMLSVFVATLMFAYGGILYVTGPAGGEAQIKKAHTVLLNAVVGILIVLLAWLIVNIVLSVLTGQGALFWTTVNQCDKNPVGAAVQPSSNNIATFPGLQPATPVTSDQLAGVNPDLVKLVNAAHQHSTVPFVVTSGFRTFSATAADSRHLYGDAIDAHPIINGVVDYGGGSKTAPDANYQAINAAFVEASRQTGVPYQWGGSSSTFMQGSYYDAEHFQLPRT